MNVPYITAGDVEHALDWLSITDALEAGHRAARPEMADQLLTFGADCMLTRAAWIGGQGGAVKSVTVMPGNPARGLPSVHGAMVLFDSAGGQVEAVIDSDVVTKWKTAADSLLGARYLARPDAASLLIVGAGAVARSLVEAYCALWSGLQVAVWSRKPEQAEALAKEYAGSWPVRAVPDLERAVGAADIVATATLAKTPLILGDWLRPGQHLDLIGAFTPDMREADNRALQRARIFVDSRDTTIGHIGELMIPIAEGAISRSDILGDLYDLAGGAVGRSSPDDITLFKNGGGAHLDLMAGRAILAAWRNCAR